MTTPPARPAPTRTDTARRRITALRRRGSTYRAIADAAGLAPMTVHALATGQATPEPATVRAVLAVTPARLMPGRIDAGGTRLRLRALHVMGHDCTRTARAAGVSPQVLRAILRGRAAKVTSSTRDAVSAVYDAWWDKQAPARTPAQKAAATRARRRAIRGNWCPAAALDDDDLDTPGYQPAHGWKPARGTGTAAEFPGPTPRPEGAQPMRQHNTDAIAGEPEVRLTQHDRARPFAVIRLGDQRKFTSHDPAYCRRVAQAWTKAAELLETARQRGADPQPEQDRKAAP
jgi:lambda repressor-like predicted transcriptional regulator